MEKLFFNIEVNKNVGRCRPEVFWKKDVFRNFAKFTWKHLYQSLFFNKVTGLRPATLLKKRLWYRCFSVNFAKVLRTTFLQNTSGRLLLAFQWNSNITRNFITYETVTCDVTCDVTWDDRDPSWKAINDKNRFYK